MPVKPFGNVTVAVKVVIAFIGITAYQICVLFRVSTEEKLCAVISLIRTVWILSDTFAHGRTVFQKSVFIGTQGIDNIVKLSFKIVCFPLYPMVIPCGEKAIS